MVRRHTIAIDVLLVRQRLDQPWRTHRWHPIGIEMVGALGGADTRHPEPVAARSAVPPTTIRCRSSLALVASELAGYRINIENGEPIVYVVLRETPDNTGPGVAVDRLSASPFAVTQIGAGTMDGLFCERVAMPERITALVRDFVSRAGDAFKPLAEGPDAVPSLQQGTGAAWSR
jgi:hypothetical protein